ncbi:hypothetical protein EYR40_002564 [Pleurotus pulmonarius]|nr:hypothetical protein EYR40_002564 [Pleurotus pulmonarius]
MLQDCPPTTTSSPNVIMTKHANEQRTTRYPLKESNRAPYYKFDLSNRLRARRSSTQPFCDHDLYGRNEGARDVSCTGEMKERGARNDECSGTVVNDVFR